MRHVARDITYANSARTRGGRVVIRAMENATGRIGLIRQAAGYEDDVARGADFWQVICDRYGIELDVIAGSLAAIPTEGPLIVVANHPYGILDGLVMGRILSRARAGDFRILAHQVFRRSPDLERVILPISFDETKAAARRNLEARAEALRYLGDGGAIGIFPGGTVSTAAQPFAHPMDPDWRTFTAKMISRSGATVVPLYFDGANSRLFQIASHVHFTLRMGMLVREFRRRAGTAVRIAVGEPIPAAVLTAYRSDPKGCMDFLRKATYELSPTPVDWRLRGHEFDDSYRKRGNGGGRIRQRAGRSHRS